MDPYLKYLIDKRDKNRARSLRQEAHPESTSTASHVSRTPHLIRAHQEVKQSRRTSTPHEAFPVEQRVLRPGSSLVSSSHSRFHSSPQARGKRTASVRPNTNKRHAPSAHAPSAQQVQRSVGYQSESSFVPSPDSDPGSQSEGVAPLSSTALRSSPFLPTPPPPLPQPSQGVLSPYEEQDLRLERSGLSKPDLKAVRCWRQTFHGANRILREHTSKKWSRRQLLKSFAAPVQPREQYMTLDRLDAACTTVQRAKGSDIQELGSRARLIGPLETAATVEFFQANTFVRSGAKTLTRRMALSKCELYGLYRAHYPMICRRAESLAQAEMYGPMCNHLSAQLVIAKKMSRVPGWSESAETERREQYFATLVDDLKADRALFKLGQLPKIPVSDDPDGIEARSTNTFWDILKRANVKYKRSEPLYNCPIHTNAGKNQRKLVKAEDELEKIEAALTVAEAADPVDATEVARLRKAVLPFRQKIAGLRKSVDTARRHQEHYATARKYVKTIEMNLIPGEVLIFRDFVNQYSELGKKVNNLVFVILRPSPDGVGNMIDYVDNFAQAKCDASFHAFALDLLFQRSDLFPRNTKVYISGDHGPHFWCWDTLAYQSTVFGKYGLKLHIVGLCSYHAYNRCDGHGAYIKKSARAEQLRGAGPTTPAEFALMVKNLPAAEARGITVCLSLLDVLLLN